MIELKIALLKKGITQNEMARRLGVSKSLMSQVLSSRINSAALRARIVREIGIHPKLVQFDPSKKHRLRPTDSHSKSRAAHEGSRLKA